MPSPVSSARTALTLLELLLLVALLAAVLGFLLPAVSRIRETSNRLTCADNLKRIGAGFHEHLTVHGRFPDGGKNQCDEPHHPFLAAEERELCAWVEGEGHERPFARTREEWSWTYQILPFIDRDRLYRQEDDDVVRRTRLPIYLCPTRRPPAPREDVAAIGYAGSAGTGENGVLVRAGQTPTAPATIPDGLDTTIMVAERRLKRDRRGWSRDDDESWADPGWDLEIYRTATPDEDSSDSLGPSPDVAHTRPEDFAYPDAGLNQFGGSHPKGINALMADGAVRFIRFRPTPAAFLRLCVRDDAMAVNLNDL